jgi:hypothetical protein
MKEIPAIPAAARGHASPSIPVIELAVPIAAGTEANLALPLVNDGSRSVNAIPYCTDFISNTGHQIPASQVTFRPRSSPLASGARGVTQLSITVPHQVGAGEYSALVQAMGLAGPLAVVVLRVA